MYLFFIIFSLIRGERSSTRSLDTTAAAANRKSANGRGSTVVNEINGSGVVNVTNETNGTNDTDRTNREALRLKVSRASSFDLSFNVLITPLPFNMSQAVHLHNFLSSCTVACLNFKV